MEVPLIMLLYELSCSAIRRRGVFFDVEEITSMIDKRGKGMPNYFSTCLMGIKKDAAIGHISN